MKKNFIIWQKEWATGIKKIDDQHKHFVGILNKTYSLNQGNRKKERLIEIIAELVEYARIHFSTEEQYFEDTEYPEKIDHEEKHADLLQKALKFNSKLLDNDYDPKLVSEFLIFLKEWLDTHLIEVDHRYVKWLTEHGIK